MEVEVIGEYMDHTPSRPQWRRATTTALPSTDATDVTHSPRWSWACRPINADAGGPHDAPVLGGDWRDPEDDNVRMRAYKAHARKA